MEEEKRSWPKIEEEILEFWKKNHIFEKSLLATKNKKPYVFYDGPPFATGLPHYGHLLGSTIKDVIGRYWTMRGHYIARRWGWDCHGLPIENIVEKELAINSRKEIETLGVKTFNDACRAQVFKYVPEWGKTVERLARWVDFNDSYKTLDNTYIESVWWAFSELYKKGLLYEGNKVLLNCPRCETPIAKAEVAMDNSYKDVTEDSVYVKFNVLDHGENLFFLAWTTTPWTLPGNVALAISSALVYVKIKKENEYYILAKDRLSVIEKPYEIIEEIFGKDLIGWKYEPLYHIEEVEKSNGPVFQMHPADFVTTEEGTGIVHTAVVYGEDDYLLGISLGLPFIPLLNAKAIFEEKAPQFLRGVYFKKADPLVIDDLRKRGLIYKTEKNTHSYPHCFRCETPLFYNAIHSWFINIQKIKERLLELNRELHWFPEYLQYGRFQKSVEGAPDWNLTRNRYWGSPMPIWKCGTCEKIKVVGSAAELPGSRKLKNRYFLLRHGEATHNLTNIASISETEEKHATLTEWGRTQIESRVVEIKNISPDIIVYSPYHRTKETMKIIHNALPEILVKEDNRLREIELQTYDGLDWSEYTKEFSSEEERFRKLPQKGGETLHMVAERMNELVVDIESQYDGKNILFISHADPLFALSVSMQNAVSRADCILNFEVGSLHELIPYKQDLHRPSVDEIIFECECGGEMKRISDVLDVWFESASMPFAQVHYPFENEKWFEENFPAQFIAEYTGQVRTWFYYMLVMSTCLFDKIPFENVVVTGVILAEDGSKMSKSKKNFPDPWKIFEKYGADSMRYYLMSDSVMNAEDINFSERHIDEIYKKFITTLQNSLQFLLLYVPDKPRGFGKIKEIKNPHILDQWILTMFETLRKNVTENMDAYHIVKATRPLMDFVQELSTWYIRRSRDRMKSDGEEKENVITILTFILKEFSKLIAPFTPFLAEFVYREVGGEKESVHLETYPTTVEARYITPLQKDDNILQKMRMVREIVSLGFAERANAGIKVRQPLLKVVLFDPAKILTEKDSEYLQLIQDELNVLTVEFSSSARDVLFVELDTDWKSYPELVELGLKRELVRNINSFRKEIGLTIQDSIEVGFETSSEELKNIFQKYADDLKHDVLAEKIIEGALSSVEKKELQIEEFSLVLYLKKI